MTVQAHSPEEAVALVVREQEQEEAEYGKYAGDPDPNPRYTSGKPASWAPMAPGLPGPAAGTAAG